MNVKELEASSTGLARVMAFTEKEEKTANLILTALEGLMVEEGVSLLEKCIIYHALFGWHREYEAALDEHFSKDNFIKSRQSNE